MKATIIFIAVLLSVSIQLSAQTKKIYGRVIDGDGLRPIRDAQILNKDTLLIGTTDIDGRFKIDIPQNTQILLFGSIRTELTTIKLNVDCDTIEIVMMDDPHYDFMSPRQIDKDRLARFNKLPGLYLQAYKKGLFTKESPCYSRKFEPEKPTLDSIIKERIEKQKKIKLAFEKLSVGDTVKIPFSGLFTADGTDRTTLYYYSIFAYMKSYDCVIQCVVTDKNTNKRGYNLVCSVVNCDKCKSPSVFGGRLMKAGEVFTYNMKQFKILNE